MLLSGFLIREKNVELHDISEQFPLLVTINHCLEEHRENLQRATVASRLRLTAVGTKEVAVGRYALLVTLLLPLLISPCPEKDGVTSGLGRRPEGRHSVLGSLLGG